MRRILIKNSLWLLAGLMISVICFSGMNDGGLERTTSIMVIVLFIPALLVVGLNLCTVLSALRFFKEKRQRLIFILFVPLLLLLFGGCFWDQGILTQLSVFWALVVTGINSITLKPLFKK